MYDRFTDRARKVMQLAKSEASRLNHSLLTAEHILLGLCKEGSGMAARIIECLGKRTCYIESDVYAMITAVAGPKYQLIGKTEEVQQLLDCAIETARLNGDKHVGTEHVLMALVSVKGTISQHILATHGINCESVLGIWSSFSFGEIGGMKAVTGRKEKPAGSVALNHEFEFTKDEVVSIAKLLSAKDLLALAQEKLGD